MPKELQKELFEPLKRACKKYVWEWDDREEFMLNITPRQKGNMFLYNYNDMVLVERNHPLLMKCRGLVLKEDGTILNFPFSRFFNEWEQEKAEIDWSSAIIQEKLDGSLICVFWNGQDWEITTRGSFYPNETQENDFAEWFKNQFQRFNQLARDHCYMFELISKNNRIVTWYDNEEVYLIGMRNLETLKEEQSWLVDLMAENLQVKRPRKFYANNIEDCKALFSNLRQDEEGLVVVDRFSNRLKIKQESYLKLSRIKMLKEQDLFDYVLGKTQIDQEYLNQLPEVQNSIDGLKVKWLIIVGKATEAFTKIFNPEESRKEFALKAIEYPFRSLLFTMLDKKDIYSLPLKWEIVKEWT